MLCVIITLQCMNFTYEKDPVIPSDLLIDVDITARGFSQYADLNFQKIAFFLEKMTLPDIKTDLIAFNLILTELRVTNVVMPKAEIRYHKNGIETVVKNWKFDFIFQFLLQQKSYPYTRDTGSGFLSMELDATGDVFGMVSESCTGHLEAGFSSFPLKIHGLRVKMYGRLEYIYDTILIPLTEYLMDAFNTYLQNPLQQAILLGLNTGLSNMWAFSETKQSVDQIVCKNCWQWDQRWARFSIDDNFMSVGSPGQLLIITDNVTRVATGWRERQRVKRQGVASNHDMQYSLQKDVFQSMYDVYSKHFSKQNVSIQVGRFAHTGLLVDIKADGITAQTLADVQIATWVFQKSYYNISVFKTEIRRVLGCEGAKCGDVESVIARINTDVKLLWPSYTNANTVNLEQCQRLYLGDWVRFGCDQFR